jgi:hypothetical protein
MASATHTKIVAAWLSSLANLTAGNAPLADASTKIAAMAKDLADDFPDPMMFTPESRKGVASACDFFPSYSRLKAFLGAWWEDNRPRDAVSGVPADLESADLPAPDRSLVLIWLRDDGEGRSRALQAVSLSVIRRHAVSGYRWLVKTNANAASIAAEHDWREAEPRREPPTDEEVEAVARIVADRFPSTTNAAGQPIPSGEPARANPAHDAAIGVLAAKVAANHNRPMGALGAETLEAVRAANPGIAATRAYQAAQKAALPDGTNQGGEIPAPPIRVPANDHPPDSPVTAINWGN